MSLATDVKRGRQIYLRDRILANDGGALWLLDGPMANNPGEAPSGAPLAIIAIDLTSFEQHPTLAQMTLDVVGYAAASGQPTWGRFVNGDGVGVWDVTAGPPGSGAQAIVSNVDIPASAQIWTGGELTVSGTFLEA